MNKNAKEIYEEVLSIVLDDYGLTISEMFGSNRAECVNARKSLIISLHDEGLSDSEIAELTQKMRRCSICIIRNNYNDKTAHWEVKHCIELVKKMKKKSTANY